MQKKTRAVVEIQTAFRTFKHRSWYKKTMFLVFKLQKQFRQQRGLRQKLAACAMQSTIRGFLCSTHWQRKRRSIIKIQACIRRYFSYETYTDLKNAVLALQRMKRRPLLRLVLFQPKRPKQNPAHHRHKQKVEAPEQRRIPFSTKRGKQILHPNVSNLSFALGKNTIPPQPPSEQKQIQQCTRRETFAAAIKPQPKQVVYSCGAYLDGSHFSKVLTTMIPNPPLVPTSSSNRNRSRSSSRKNRHARPNQSLQTRRQAQRSSAQAQAPS